MVQIWIYNHRSKRVEKYERALGESMPYIENDSLTVDEFRGSSKSNLLWSDLRFLQTWNAFRRFYNRPIPVGYCFKRIWEGGHGSQSQHYAGGAFDCGQALSADARDALYRSAVAFGEWSYVEPQFMTPSWVHFDKRLTPPACSAGGYIFLKEGARGVYVLILQDALNAIGFTGSGLDGYFGGKTKRSVANMQKELGLSVDGQVGCETWTALTRRAVGIGRTSTVINP